MHVIFAETRGYHLFDPDMVVNEYAYAHRLLYAAVCQSLNCSRAAMYSMTKVPLKANNCEQGHTAGTDAQNRH